MFLRVPDIMWLHWSKGNKSLETVIYRHSCRRRILGFRDKSCNLETPKCQQNFSGSALMYPTPLNGLRAWPHDAFLLKALFRCMKVAIATSKVSYRYKSWKLTNFLPILDSFGSRQKMEDIFSNYPQLVPTPGYKLHLPNATHPWRTRLQSLPVLDIFDKSKT